jgi:hypothetical protein
MMYREFYRNRNESLLLYTYAEVIWSFTAMVLY